MENKADNKTIIIRNVPDATRKALKSKAALEGKTMQAVILELITNYIKKGGK